jgi:hypothetical protein
MLEKPFEVAGALARKIQDAANRVAEKASRVAKLMERKVQAIERRRVARADERLMKRLPRKPTIRFEREVVHGRASLSVYRVTDHRAGTVRRLYGVNRIHPDGGRTRIAVRARAELLGLRNVVDRSLVNETRTQRFESAPRTVERVQSPKRKNASGVERAAKVEVGPGQKRWYTLVYAEKFGVDGLGAGRVVRSFTTLKEAKAHQGRHPGLLIKERVADHPLRQGSEIPLKLGVGLARRIDQDRHEARRREQLKLAVSRPASTQEHARKISR